MRAVFEAVHRLREEAAANTRLEAGDHIVFNHNGRNTTGVFQQHQSGWVMAKVDGKLWKVYPHNIVSVFKQETTEQKPKK